VLTRPSTSGGNRWLALGVGREGVDRRKDLATLRGVMDDRRVRSRHLRQGKRLSNGTVVVAEYDDSGRLLRETHYTPDRAWVTKIVDRSTDQGDHPTAR
jgi:hypothetical protein